ncbi:MAG: DUF3810 domain-containing protein [Clostridia bacterium]|nr:DUF3810 domain-containing protein [Clostridia bacterium]MBR2927352.1 DUF3810 domain-containing protein [Clostridia bacterium]
MTDNQAPTPIKRRLPRVCLVIYALFAVSCVLYALFRISSPFAEWFNHHISVAGRFLLATLTSWIPFSLTELLLLLLPVTVFLLVLLAIKKYADSWRNSFVYLGILFSIVATVAILFVWNFAAGYFAAPIEEKLGIAREKVSAEELYGTAEILRKELDAMQSEIIFLEDGASLMPYSYSEMNGKLMDAYTVFCKKYGVVDHFSSSVKPIMLSEPMSYTHITGVYTFFTGEANLNVNFPDYTLPFTAAHELAHQRGIAREDEANFIAFLVCRESEDPYIRYSGFLNAYEYVLSALYSADYDLYAKTYGQLPRNMIEERIAYSRFFDKYRENVAADISQSTNNSYLISQGNPEGTKSYNLVVDLTVAFYKNLGLVKTE